MEMIKSFNNTIRYIESVLDDKIDENEIAKRSTYSYAMFSRLFSILTNMTLSEYIRLRRLSKAAIEIRTSHTKILDIAMKYGYESSDSFSSAFKTFHGVTPTEVRQGMAYKIVSPMQLSLSVRGGKDMEVTIQRKGAMKVGGIALKNIEADECSLAWQRLYTQYNHETLAGLGNGTSYGVCSVGKALNKIDYLAAYDLSRVESVDHLHMDIMNLESAEYAVLRLQGKVPECIREGWKYALEVFFPEESYRPSDKPDLEVYSEGDMTKNDYQMELWIPVEKN